MPDYSLDKLIWGQRHVSFTSVFSQNVNSSVAYTVDAQNTRVNSTSKFTQSLCSVSTVHDYSRFTPEFTETSAYIFQHTNIDAQPKFLSSSGPARLLTKFISSCLLIWSPFLATFLPLSQFPGPLWLLGPFVLYATLGSSLGHQHKQEPEP